MLLQEKLKNKTIILASNSPRRQHLLKQMDIDFEVQIRETDETFPENLKREDIAIYLCKKKAAAFGSDELCNIILIAADTIVWLDGKVLGKPSDNKDAVRILKKLSGQKHEVITGVCLKSDKKEISFFSCTQVYFKALNQDEIDHYIRQYKPFDKAGAYGIQEWIGYTGIFRIEGSYYNVMGLPTARLYEQLMEF